jgi:hypothetical protein
VDENKPEYRRHSTLGAEQCPRKERDRESHKERERERPSIQTSETIFRLNSGLQDIRTDHGETDGRKDRHTDEQTDSLTYRHTDRQTMSRPQLDER